MDFAEERWPSMDLVAAMLLENVNRLGAPEIYASGICAPFTRGLTRIPLLERNASALNADRLYNRFWSYPKFLRKQVDRFDLFHIVDHSYSQLIHELPPGRAVVTCHDLDTFRCLLTPHCRQRSFAFRAMARRILDGLQRAARVICVSNWTRDQILRYKLIPAERLEVIPEGVGPVFCAHPNRKADFQVDQLLRRPDPSQSYLLHVGSTMARKRIDIVLRSFADVHRELPRTRLLRVGGPFSGAQMDLVRSLNIENAITVLPFVAADVLAAVYRRSTILLLPSEAEGFGLPVIEALACGTPVLASNLAVLHEVGGSAVEYCPVADVDAWTRVIVSLLNERELRPNQWTYRRERGISHAAEFTWAANAKRTIATYSSLLN